MERELWAIISLVALRGQIMTVNPHLLCRQNYTRWDICKVSQNWLFVHSSFKFYCGHSMNTFIRRENGEWLNDECWEVTNDPHVTFSSRCRWQPRALFTHNQCVSFFMQPAQMVEFGRQSISLEIYMHDRCTQVCNSLTTEKIPPHYVRHTVTQKLIRCSLCMKTVDIMYYNSLLIT